MNRRRFLQGASALGAGLWLAWPALAAPPRPTKPPKKTTTTLAATTTSTTRPAGGGYAPGYQPGY